MHKERRLTAVFAILLFAAALSFFALEKRRAGFPVSAGSVSAQSDAESGEMEERKKIALTFDDDVIIGLSQEISYKEAVSMI